MNRRKFFATSAALGIGSASFLARGISLASQYKKQDAKYHWRLVTSWTEDLPIFQDSAKLFADTVNFLTEGKVYIEVFPANALCPPLGVFNAVSSGEVEIGCSASYYWAEKIPGAEWFSAVPFGLNPQGMNAWLFDSGGLELWESLYAPFNVVPRPMGNTGVQMAGWFKNPIEDVKGFENLRIRCPGLGGRILQSFGAIVTLLPVNQLFEALQKGYIDALEWVGPVHDLKMEFFKAARFYYYPGWQEPATNLEIIFNRSFYEKLPPSLKSTLDHCSKSIHMQTLAEFDSQNGSALHTLINEKGVELRQLNPELIANLKNRSIDIVQDEASRYPSAKEIHEAFSAFKQTFSFWSRYSGKAFYYLL